MPTTNIARIIGVIVSALVGYGAEHGMNLDPVTITTLMIAAYSLIHRLISRTTNPGDAASPTMTAVDKATNEEAKS